MADVDAEAIQQDLIAGVAAELDFAGVEQIGRGGFGVVYRCAQPELDRMVAVKVLTNDLDPENLDRFLREQRAMGRLSGHPHIVTVLQVGTTRGGRPFIVMPYHGKGSLWGLVSAHGPLDWREALSIGVKLAGALEAAHRAGILHRDVKPGNVLLTDYGEPQLTDFGLARIAGGFETRSGVVIGSPAFIAPELLEGATPTTGSDVYSLGATLFCALTGHPPMGRSIPETLRDRGVPDDVVAVIETAMIRDPSRRPGTALEFGEQLREVQRRHRIPTDDMVVPVELRRAGSPRAGASDHRRDATPTPPAPATKYRPPASVQSLVPRDRLTALLRAAGRRRLILLYAPSGYGKTTLVAQWRAELTDYGVTVAWLTVDDDDNNVVWFLAHLLAAIRRVRPTLAEPLEQLLEQRGDEATRYVLTSLIDAIDETGEPVTLVIDDWQRVSDAHSIDALRYLIDHGCDHLQIIVTSWSRAGLPLSKLRVRDELVEIDCEKLRFDTDEARSLLNEAVGLQLAGSDVAALTASTDGWVAGLQMAKLSLRGGGDAGALVSRMSGESEAVGEFLAENVLDILDPQLVDFMMATSITERICGELASVLAGVAGGHAMLEDVERRGLFLRHIDHEPQWFRYHQMFAGFLRRRLERDNPGRLNDLHRTASAWFAERGHISEAVDHALAAGETGRAVDLVEDIQTRALINQSRMTTFLGLVEKLPPQLVTSRPLLQLPVAWANILLHRSRATEAALDRFTAALATADLPEARRAELTLEANVVRAVAEIYADRTDGLEGLLAEVMSRAHELRPVLPQAAAIALAFAAIQRFDFPAAQRLLEWVEPFNEQVGAVGAVYARSWSGIAARQQLDIPLALRRFREAFETGTAVGPHSYAARIAGAVLGEMLYETGELDEAAELLEESYHLGPEGGGVDYLVARYVVGAKTKAAQGDREAAAGRLDAGMAVAEKLRLPRLAAAITHERVRQGLPIDPAEAARLRAGGGIPRAGDGIATLTAELDAASGIRLLARSHAGDDRDEACRRAAALLAGIDPAARPLAALQARLLLVETVGAAGRGADAQDDIAAVRTLCTQHGLPRLLIDAGLG
ncbi:serine/threonine-protein kinase [Mycobacterium seoulense]|uniref:non-specific serine/threonine protein kinase n=1 Tax=Mycobacterium seoulense TaxID=386911 RepID=A0A7I7NVI7_9MYCO|nr:serine/threonine-protein kinase [Mycobacterium seoulense]MCV7440252.1 protein kinase [Mycobacterium seoulense]BBY00194.1 serine/threonine-protein kinase PknK [Mycobacterium seoulense]